MAFNKKSLLMVSLLATTSFVVAALATTGALRSPSAGGKTTTALSSAPPASTGTKSSQSTSIPSNSNTPESSATNPSTFDWKILRKYDTKTSTVPDELKKFNQKFIKIPGFIVPLEDNAGQLTEFLLVPNQMSCVHVPPPPPNFIFYVTNKNKAEIKNQWEPVWITGQLSIGKSKVHGDDYFLSINAVRIDSYDPMKETYP